MSLKAAESSASTDANSPESRRSLSGTFMSSACRIHGKALLLLPEAVVTLSLRCCFQIVSFSVAGYGINLKLPFSLMMTLSSHCTGGRSVSARA